ncbi:MAG: hypothetical protein CVT61_01465 [Actinobacteria bacterium HGW-Actinobacteria-11]|nr:MAG: hypothetical protein CVT61_01465 [Actinobacteria bacterium HGW-Actinobacteria-11]
MASDRLRPCPLARRLVGRGSGCARWRCIYLCVGESSSRQAALGKRLMTVLIVADVLLVVYVAFVVFQRIGADRMTSSRGREWSAWRNPLPGAPGYQ